MKIITQIASGFEQLITSKWGQFFLYALFSIAALSPFLFHRAFLSDGDAFGQNYPAFGLYSIGKLLSGEVFWNAQNFHGFPHFVGDGLAFAPTTYLLRAVFSPLDALHVFTAVAMTLTGFCFCVLMRRLGRSPLASFTGGIAYIAACWTLLHDPTVATFFPLLPLLLLVTLDLPKHPVRSSILTWLLLSTMWLTVYYQFIPFVLIAFGCVTLVMAWRSRTIRVPLLGALLILLSIPIGLLRIIPSLMVYGPLSFRTELSFAEAQAGMNIGAILQPFFPHLHLPILSTGGVWLYLGASGFALLLLCLRHDRRPVVRLCLLSYVLCLLIALPNSPLFWLLHQLPVFSLFRGQVRWMFLGNAAAAVLVAYGFDAFQRPDRVKARKWIARLYTGLGVLGVLGGFGAALASLWQESILTRLYAFFDAHIYAASPYGYLPEHYHQYIANMFGQLTGTLSLLSYRHAASIFALAVTAWLFHDRFWKKPASLRPQLMALSMSVLTFAILFPWYPRLPLTSFPPKSEVAEFLKTHEGLSMSFLGSEANFQMLSVPFHPDEEENFLFNNEYIGPNVNLLYGLSSAEHYNPIQSRRMGRLITWAGSDQIIAGSEAQFARLPITVKEKRAMLAQRTDILNILNIKYIVTAWDLPAPFRQVFKTVTQPFGIPIYVYENPAPRPYAYFADDIVTFPVEEHSAMEAIQKGVWPSRRTLLECDRDCPVKMDGKGSVLVNRPSSVDIKVSTESQTSQILVISENNLPGWIVTVDGAEVHPWMANSVFFGIPIKEGKHQVELRFSYWRVLESAL